MRNKPEDYITYRVFEDMTLSGYVRRFVPGDKLKDKFGILINRDKEPICTVHSQNSRHHFAWNVDGMGIQRGRMAYALTEAARKNRIGFRFNGAERDELVRRWSKYLQGGETILFNDRLFRASIRDLYDLADYFYLDPDCY